MVRSKLINKLELILADEIIYLLEEYQGSAYKKFSELLPLLFLSYKIEVIVEKTIILNYLDRKIQKHRIVIDRNNEELQSRYHNNLTILRTRYEISTHLGTHLSLNLNNNELEKLWFHLI